MAKIKKMDLVGGYWASWLSGVARVGLRLVVVIELLVIGSRGVEGASMDESTPPCVFPDVYHGVYETQRPDSFQTTGKLEYSEVVINFHSMSPWGKCVERNRNSFILEDRTPAAVGGGASCLRCVRVESRSPNVVQLYMQDPEQARCSASVEDARLRCPAPNDHAQETTLYRKDGFVQDSGQESSVQKTFCPIAGKYEFIYRNSRLPVHSGLPSGLPRIAECDIPTSTVANCPYGFGLTFDYIGCSFPDRRESFQCLGDWSVPGNPDVKYFALADLSAPPNAPKYKCGMFREEQGSSTIFLSMATDSTCRNGLRGPEDGAETWMMKPVVQPPPREVSSCTFPEWTQGEWENLKVNGGTLKLRDDGQFRTITASCLQDFTARRGEMFFVYAKSQCGEDMYSCVWIKQRGKNVLELTMGQPSSSMNWTSCAAHESSHSSATWSTHPRSEAIMEKNSNACALSGEFLGAVPESRGLCMHVATDCQGDSAMYYKIVLCPNGPEPLIRGVNPSQTHAMHGSQAPNPSKNWQQPETNLRQPFEDNFGSRWEQTSTTKAPRNIFSNGQQEDWSQLFGTGSRNEPTSPARVPIVGDNTERAQVFEMKPVQRQNGPTHGNPNMRGQRPPQRRPQHGDSGPTDQGITNGPARRPPRPIWRSKRETETDQQSQAENDEDVELLDPNEELMVSASNVSSSVELVAVTGNSSANSSSAESLPTAQFSRYVQLHNSRSRGGDYNRDVWSRGVGSPYDPLEFHSRQHLQPTTQPPYDRRAPWHRGPSREVTSEEDRDRYGRPRTDRWQEEDARGVKKGTVAESSTKFAKDDDIPRLEPGWSERKQKQINTNLNDARTPDRAEGTRYFEYDLNHHRHQQQHGAIDGYPESGPGGHPKMPGIEPVNQLPWRPQHPDHLPTEYKFSVVGGASGDDRHQQIQPGGFPPHQQGPGSMWHPQQGPHPGLQGAAVPATSPFINEPSWLQPPQPEKSHQREFPPLQPDTSRNRPRIYSAGEVRHYDCLGHWEEKGVEFTYLKRTDAPGYECFMLRRISDSEVIMEATGTHCQRPEPHNQQNKDSSQAIRLLKKPQDSCNPINHNQERQRQQNHQFPPNLPQADAPLPKVPFKPRQQPPQYQPAIPQPTKGPSPAGPTMPKLGPPNRSRVQRPPNAPQSRSQTKKPAPGPPHQPRPQQPGNWNKNAAQQQRAATTRRPWKPVTAGPNKSDASWQLPSPVLIIVSTTSLLATILLLS